jgi:lipopolysaccharide transport system ATP-binding protein
MTLWALRDVSIAVAPGEVLGLIGRNGAGKTTLLKILSRITYPTAGRVTMRGRVASLLEVGTGFHPELTGRENVYLNGSILGMTRSEIRQRFDEIVDFADVERFLDTPIKRYSSGMYVRLAFAVAAHLEPEILLVDEVLAVGDLLFQQKCLGKMQTIASSGRTVLFVSHNMAAINALCTRAVRLRGGRLVDDGDAAGVVGRYVAENFVAARARDYPREPSRSMQIRRIEISSVAETPGGLLYRTIPFEIRLRYDVNRPTVAPEVVLSLEKPDGAVICQTREDDRPQQRVMRREPGTYEATIRFPASILNAGTFVVRASIERMGGHEQLDAREGLTFQLHDPVGEGVVKARGLARRGDLYLTLPWSTAVLSTQPNAGAEPSTLVSAPG